MASDASNVVEMVNLIAIEEYFDADYKNELCDKLFEQFKSGECCDTSLVAGVDQLRLGFIDELQFIQKLHRPFHLDFVRFFSVYRISVHRAVLSAASLTFNTLLNGSVREAKRPCKDVITISGVTGDTLQALVRFCYTGKLGIKADNADEVLAVATRLKVVRVEKLCERHYLKALSLKNCLGLWLLAEQHNFDQLKKAAYATVMDSFQRLVSEPEFLHLKKERLQKVLEDANLSVYSEDDAFDALVAWIRFDEDNRKAHFGELIKLHRLKEMKRSVIKTNIYTCIYFNQSL